MASRTFIPPEHVLASIYGKTSRETRMSEKRRDEVIAAAIFACFRNQEFGTRFQLPADFKRPDLAQDASGIDIVVADHRGRRKMLQIKGVYIERSIERRRQHRTKGLPRAMGRRTLMRMQRDSEELAKMMKDELSKIRQDYSGLCLIIHVIADLASQTSLDIALRQCRKVIERIKAKEIWFLRHVPVRAVFGKKSQPNCHTYKLIKVIPDEHTYVFSFAL